MNWYTLFYLFSILEKLTIFFAWGAGIFTIGSIFLLIIYFVNKDRINSNALNTNTYQIGLKWLKSLRWIQFSSIFFMIFFWILIIIIPTRRDMLIIIAGGAVGEFISTDQNARQLPADITKFLRGEILKATTDLSVDIRHELGTETELDKIKKLSREELEKLMIEKIKTEKSEGK